MKKYFFAAIVLILIPANAVAERSIEISPKNSITGNGQDDQGGIFNFVFGLSEAETIEFINQRANLNKAKANAEKNKSK
jgi:hypothetical protein